MNDGLTYTLDTVRSTLEQLRRWGWRGCDCSERSLAAVDGWSRPLARKPSDQPSDASLEDIRSDLGECRRCGLSAGRTHIVFGEGHPHARLVFVGEGPGRDEDRCGRPFVGPAGQLLDRIVAAMKLKREEVYICNIIKCRPPDNRDPLPDEVATCKPFLERQLSVIQPDAICALGAHAARALLDTDVSLAKLRGRFHTYAGVPLMPTYHPAYLLRHPEDKRAVWEDMQKIMAFLRIPL